MEEKRRRLPRQQTEWPGRYTVEGASERSWGSCEVLDISILGAGLELHDTSDAEDLIGHPILVEVHTPAGASITLQLMGEIRYVGEGKRGGIRVGLEFAGLSPTEKQILDVLEHMRAVW